MNNYSTEETAHPAPAAAAAAAAHVDSRPTGLVHFSTVCRPMLRCSPPLAILSMSSCINVHRRNGPLSPTPAHPHVPHIFTPPPKGFPRRVLVVQVSKGDNYLCRMRMAAACENLIALQTRLVHTVCASDRTVWVHWAKPLQHLWHTPCKHYACASRFWVVLPSVLILSRQLHRLSAQPCPKGNQVLTPCFQPHQTLCSGWRKW